MIQIESLKIKEFRGVRDLELNLGGKSFVVYGPNGSGKSGVVDAIDFALTGNVARLSGAGTGTVSVQKHGPHVHQRDNPAAAEVSLSIRHVASGQRAVLTRNIKTANRFTLNPNTPEMVVAVEWTAQHPELALSRREVIKYVNAEPGKRAQEVQALLKLDRIDETRRLLRAALTKTSSDAKAADNEVAAAEDAMRRHLDLSSLLSTDVATAINKQRELLGLDPVEMVDIHTDLNAGASTGAPSTQFNKASAVRDVRALADYLGEHADLIEPADKLVSALDELDADPNILSALQHRGLVEAGIFLVTEAVCPLCDLAWPDVHQLRAHLQEKLERSQAAAALQQRIRAAATELVAELGSVRGLIRSVQPQAVTMAKAALKEELLDWSNKLASFETSLGSIESAREQREQLAADPLNLPATVVADLDALLSELEALPDQSATEGARSFLTVAQERWGRVRQARTNAAKARAAHATAAKVYETYNGVADAALTTLYATVEKSFSAYYCQINSDDESSFKAGLEPSAGKLDLEVDFYGLGMFPPNAYHSEGHQDGMGVCLYLALIGQLLKDDFRLAVLDDVVTSVDNNHRRQFCKLLKDVFPDVQFIITTHDDVWARQISPQAWSAGVLSRAFTAGRSMVGRCTRRARTSGRRSTLTWRPMRCPAPLQNCGATSKA
jgi:recombinational DNA repair ATPase RecF